MQTDYQITANIPLEIALLSQSEDPCVLPPLEQEKSKRTFEKVTHSFQTLLTTPPKELAQNLASSNQRPDEQIQSLFDMLENLTKALFCHEATRVQLLDNSLRFSILSSHLHSLGLNFALATEAGFWDHPLPYERLEQLPEWADYVSFFHSSIWSPELLQSHFMRSKAIQAHLQEKERIRLVLLEIGLLCSATVHEEEAFALVEGAWRRNIRIRTLPTEDSDPTQGLETTIEQGVFLAQATQELGRRLHFGATIKKEFPSAPKMEFDVGYHLMRAFSLMSPDGESLINLYKSRLGHLSQLEEMDRLLASHYTAAVRKLRGTLAHLVRRHRSVAELRFNFVGHRSDALTQKIEKIESRVEVLTTQMRMRNKTSLSSAGLRSLIQRVSTATLTRGEHFFAQKGQTSVLFLSLMTRFSIASQDFLVSAGVLSPSLSEQASGRGRKRPIYHHKIVQTLLQLQTSLSSLFPPVSIAPTSTEAPLSSSITQEVGKAKKIKATKGAVKRRGKGKKKARKISKAKKIAPQPIPSPKSAQTAALPAVQEEVQEERADLLFAAAPTVAAPVVGAEAKQLAQLAQMPIRIKRHPRTYNRPEFAYDRRNQALHYLPPQLVQMLLQKDNPFIAKYVQWEETDPNFAGNHSARATVLCHDRRARQVYIGELSVGVTPKERRVYHIYLNPYTNPLGGRQHLEQSVVDRPPNDLLEEEDGFTSVGDCQLSYNELLHTIDAADKESDRFYRVFPR